MCVVGGCVWWRCVGWEVCRVEVCRVRCVRVEVCRVVDVCGGGVSGGGAVVEVCVVEVCRVEVCRVEVCGVGVCGGGVSGRYLSVLAVLHGQTRSQPAPNRLLGQERSWQLGPLKPSLHRQAPLMCHTCWRTGARRSRPDTPLDICEKNKGGAVRREEQEVLSAPLLQGSGSRMSQITSNMVDSCQSSFYLRGRLTNLQHVSKQPSNNLPTC
ncbi:unnamed protein product [Pleuronectes platessa]|uniref:Uncharacterized protein n=1 Tax=Pleuronectes platessa TaxID=8262 RepID=A0A9N7U160_PLEPL|nr:unnamed protein product [Pleuronectes platessa]